MRLFIVFMIAILGAIFSSIHVHHREYGEATFFALISIMASMALAALMEAAQ